MVILCIKSRKDFVRRNLAYRNIERILCYLDILRSWTITCEGRFGVRNRRKHVQRQWGIPQSGNENLADKLNEARGYGRTMTRRRRMFSGIDSKSGAVWYRVSRRVAGVTGCCPQHGWRGRMLSLIQPVLRKRTTQALMSPERSIDLAPCHRWIRRVRV